ncbi:ABC transporter C member 13 [Physocladia obscura]|uniref:ABC transporter C member 13 n=1 Tax=Physocladia obscura TaxID=109957 RepID=A0AAD5SYP7_9FUNG|nr:ABC transporter C member 13 [Physocladia obscura]
MDKKLNVDDYVAIVNGNGELSQDTIKNFSEKLMQQHLEEAKTNMIGEATDGFNFMTLGWLSKMIRAGAKWPLQFDDLPEIPTKSKSDAVTQTIAPFYAQLETYLKKKQLGKKPSYCGLIWHHVAVAWSFSVLMDVAATVLQTTQTAVMSAILNILAVGNPQFFISNPVALAICFQTVTQMFRKMRYNIRSILTTAIYAKALKLSNVSATEFKKGRILQMVNVDVSTVLEIIASAHQIFLVPFQLGFAFYYLYTLFGTGLWPVGVVFGAFITVAPVFFGIVVVGQQKYMKSGDKRLSTLREIFEVVGLHLIFS